MTQLSGIQMKYSSAINNCTSNNVKTRDTFLNEKFLNFPDK